MDEIEKQNKCLNNELNELTHIILNQKSALTARDKLIDEMAILLEELSTYFVAGDEEVQMDVSDVLARVEAMRGGK